MWYSIYMKHIKKSFENEFLPWSCPLQDLENFFNTSKNGLSEDEAAGRLKKTGPNLLPEPKPGGRLEIFLNQFRSPLILVLLMASGISIALRDFVDAVVIFAAVAVNVVLGFYQEFKADRALSKLKKFLEASSLVIRDGSPFLIDVRFIVPGDVVVLRAGDKVSADGRIIEAHNFFVNEAILAGESAAVKKSVGTLESGTPLFERKNMVFSGTTVFSGKALVIVSATGGNTEIGKIALEVKEIKDVPTPLQVELRKLAVSLGIIFVSLALAIFVIGIVQGRTFIEMFTLAVALSVAAIPEGMPLAVTVILAVGMQSIVKRKALVRKLVAAETLGGVTVMCIDKTGTITEGELRVSHIWTPGDDEEKKHESSEIMRTGQASHLLALKIGMLCNDALARHTEEDMRPLQIFGDPLDKALFLAGSEAGLEKEKLLKEATRLDEIPFSEERKFMATLHKIEGNQVIYLKGAPEFILKHSAYESLGGRPVALAEESKKRIKARIESFAKKGLRTVAVSYKLAGGMKSFGDGGVAVDDFVFVGLLGMRDPVRDGVEETLRFAGCAGVKAVMITGDHKETARAVAFEVGIPSVEKNILDGTALDKMSDKELEKIVSNIFIYARVEPRHKIRIVEALRRSGQVVAMTGDGVNDVPAIKGADIGIALGSGTDAAKEVSDVVLLDDNVKTVVGAIEQGRIIFENIKKVVLYLLVSSFSEVIIVAGSLFLRLPLPVLPAQILWVNLVEDSFPNMALAFDPGDKDLMKHPPRRGGVSIWNGTMRYTITITSLVTDTALFALFYFLLKTGFVLDEVRTLIFVALGIDSLFFIYVIRSLYKPFWKTNPLGNPFITLSVFVGFALLTAAVYAPPLQRILGTVPLNFNEWIMLVSVAILKMFFIEFIKSLFIRVKKII